MPASETILRLRDLLHDSLGPLLPRGEAYALVDYPAYANVGDSAIWLGALRLLKEKGAGPPAYACTSKTYDPETLRGLVGSGPILITGGGNFGDVYGSSQSLRRRLVRDFPGNRIVQLPQSIHYADEASVERDRVLLGSHADLTIVVRDEHSLATARERLGVESLLCPDLAFALAPLPRPAPQTDGFVCLLRRDDEAHGERPEGAGALESVDWPPDPRQGLFGLQRKLRKRLARAPARRRRLAAALQRTFEPAARRRVQRGCAILGAGRAVVTDRLHGHVLSLLMGIPHVVRDNSYGKNRRFHDLWTHDAPNAWWCEDSLEACVRRLEEELAG